MGQPPYILYIDSCPSSDLVEFEETHQTPEAQAVLRERAKTDLKVVYIRMILDDDMSVGEAEALYRYVVSHFSPYSERRHWRGQPKFYCMRPWQ